MNISVIIPTYNAENYIEKAVNSALQFPQVKEVIVVEDCSTDKTLEKCKILAKKNERVKLYQHPDKKNHGDSTTRNLGIEMATCEYIAFLDADDYYLPNRFDAELEIFKDPIVDGVFGAIGTEFISEQGKKEFIEKFGNNTLCTVNYPAEGKDVFFKMTERPCSFGASFSMIALTVKKNALENPRIRMSDHIKIHQDNDFIIRLAYHAYLKTGIIDRPIAIRTAHETNSITKTKNLSIQSFKNGAILHKALYDWANKQKNFPKDRMQYFKLKYLSDKIASETGLKKYFNFVRYAIINPKLLKTRYRYYALKNNKI